MNIAALVSGGVDSSVVVHLLKEQGFTPDIFYIRIGMEDEEGYIDCPAEEDIEITQWNIGTTSSPTPSRPSAAASPPTPT